MFRRNTNRKKTRHSSSTQTQTHVSTSDTTPATTTGAKSDIAMSDYAKRCRNLMEILRDLMAIGASFPFDLPRVVVIGGQSSGKSSLVEAVSGITVPRDSGICTRCPMVCNMSSVPDVWSCTIQLVHEYDVTGSPILGTSGPIPFGPTIHDRSLVELWIRRAQSAILSPHRDPSDFTMMSEAELKSNTDNDPDILQFSKNSVRVNVSDPNATDISFVDLPGLIQNAHERLIKMVRSLVESYIDGENTLIVIAIPMTDDMEMIQAVKLAKAADPERERTIGVMTKPDGITKGAVGIREKWRAVLEGREHATTHGYFCVRLPDDDERGRHITTHEAQKNAAEFFDTTDPWKNMKNRGRFGIPNFVENISGLLVGLIEKNLQGLKDAVKLELENCEREIATLPPTRTTDPTTETILCVNAFCRDITSATRGDKFKYFVQTNKARYFEFKQDVERTTPDFRPFKHIHDQHSRCLVTSGMEPRGLPYVRDAIGKAITWELSGVPFEAIQNLVTEHTSLWSSPSCRCFDAIFDNLCDFVEKIISHHFGRYESLSRYISKIVFKEIDKCREHAYGTLLEVLKFETTPLFTMNRLSFDEEKKSWYQKYYDAHTASQNSRQLGVYVTPSHIVLQHAPSHGSPQIPVSVRPTWEVDDELKVMATVQAYFQVAYKRLVDNVPLTIEHELNQEFAEGIEKVLLDRLLKDIADGCIVIHELLREDPELERKRDNLNQRAITLHEIKDKLDLLQPRKESSTYGQKRRAKVVAESSDMGPMSATTSDHMCHAEAARLSD